MTSFKKIHGKLHGTILLKYYYIEITIHLL